jgi:hypothetical protein
MPILPHGMGTYYNVYGEAINFLVRGTPIGYGEYMSYKGEIIGAGINFYADPTVRFKIHVVNYSTGRAFNFAQNAGPNLTGSVSYNTAIPFPTNGTAAGAGIVTTNPNPYPSIQFASGEYIGIYVDGTPVPSGLGYNTLNIAVEGTLYLNIIP